MTALARLLACAVTVGVAGLLCDAQAVAAQPSDATAKAETLGGQARDAYRAGKYSRAIELYLEAYETASSAGFLFNIAYIYDKKTGDIALARDYYQRAAAFEGAAPELVAKARARAAELAVILARPPDTGPGEGPDGKGPGDGSDGKGPGDGSDGKGPGDGSDGKGPGDGSNGEGPGDGADGKGPGDGPGGTVEPSTDPLPWVVLGTGAAVLGVGIALGGIASGTESDFHAATDNDTKRSLQSTGKAQAAAADVLMVVGAVAVGTGLALWLLDDEDEGQGSVHVTPTVMQGGAGVVIGGAL